MDKADIVASQFSRPSEQGGNVFVVVGAAAAVGRFSVNRNAAQKNRLPVEQYLGAVGFDGSKSHFVFKLVAVGRKRHPVQLWMFGRPELQACRRQSHRCLALRVQRRSHREPRFGNGDSHSFALHRALNVHPTLDRRTRAIEAQIVLVDKALRHVDQGNIARNASVVPPVCIERGDAVGQSRIVDRHHNEVRACVELLRSLAVEAGESSLVIANVFTVDPDHRPVVGRANVEKCPVVGLWVEFETALVPDQALVIEELLALRVPVSRHLQRGRFAEVIFNQVSASRLRLGVQKVSVRFHFVMKGV